MKLLISKQRKTWWAISGALALASLVAMVISFTQFGYPVKPGLDFVGGTRLQMERDCSKADCAQPIDPAQVRAILDEQGLGNSSVQVIGDNKPGTQGIVVRTITLDGETRTKLRDRLAKDIGPFDPETTQIDTVGPVLGKQILASGLLALLVSFGGIVAYLSVRFKLDYAILSIVALFHDVFITVGVFSVLGLVLGWEVDSLFIVALLTITGFSVNDTVVIYDRIRETLQLNPDAPMDQIVDDAVNQTLSRSINTTLTTLLTLTSIFLFGGVTLKAFALALIVGFVLGAYSSIFVASSLLGWWRERSSANVALAQGPEDGFEASE
ncbi:MAG: protein translocase subunit SecF [Synechococcales cyanobacterium RU_4_20]|nr:protein translocase subunit SecF [Synechococcales cyanobacterium RU_4_20]NJR69671.1 protein translocase subunit SecF [Synechococcales cyanobacterium CRU_2_2]